MGGSVSGWVFSVPLKILFVACLLSSTADYEPC